MLTTNIEAIMNPGRMRAAIIVGAGPAGLAASRELAQRGVAHVVLERGAIGESWRRYYDGLVLHTGRHLSSLPGLPFRRADPLFIRRDAPAAARLVSEWLP